jgi:cyanophycin synthetase
MLLAQEAQRRGVLIKHLNPYQDDEAFLELNFKRHKEFIVGQRSSKTTLSAYWTLENKELTKYYLKKENINVAEGMVFKKGEMDKIFSFGNKIGLPVVAKPIFGAHGNLVFMGIDNKEKCESATRNIFEKNKHVLIEKEFKGNEYRFIATKNKVLAVTYRDPANIIGDGIHTIKELVEIKNDDPRRGEENEKPLTRIIIDSIVEKNLSDEGIRVNDIIRKDKKIYLRKNSNISTGGDSIDVTDSVHPLLKKIAIKSVRAIPGLAYAGVDILINRKIDEKPSKTSYIVIELNSSCGIYPQHFPYQGKPRDVAKGIIDILFPETKGKIANKYVEYFPSL